MLLFLSSERPDLFYLASHHHQSTDFYIFLAAPSKPVTNHSTLPACNVPVGAHPKRNQLTAETQGTQVLNRFRERFSLRPFGNCSMRRLKRLLLVP
jgi:hypothetical protein